jgi:hypothetical protein
VTYFLNKFQTTNTDDFLISSTYSGVNLGVTLYYPYRIALIKTKYVTLAFNNVEAGFGLAPSVQVSDDMFKRGSEVSGRQLSFNAGIELNLAIKPLRFTNDLFFVLEGGRQIFDLSFKGPTEGTLPSGALIPENVHNTETQTWYGIRIKYNMRDYLGEFFYGL